MIESILIANRGEIARRIVRTCRDMGIRALAVYSDADQEAPFVKEADHAVRLGAAPAAESYLDAEKIVTLALGNGVDAIHPGYGFLAENPAFCEACESNGIVFIGPPAGVIRAMGDKGGAKQAMEAAGVPVVPGYVGEEQEEGVLAEAAGQVGYPVLLKAVAGGGGRGIRLVERAEDFPAAFESARRESSNAFGDDRLMVEKFLIRPRHVEFQVLADTHGKVLHLFERECSIQRRHQKIVEEAPSPALGVGLRARMAEAAVLAVRSIGYVGAGTVEFMVDQQDAFYFLEMNTRLQVEHPVTEMTLGLDLVRLQIEIAEGGPLSLEQGELAPHGHAIECRLNAEDPSRGFLPSAGPLRAFSFPEGPGLRADTGFESGNEISPYYDSLLGKLIAWGETRDEALRRMGRLLAESRVAGIATNLSFLQGVVGHAAFRSGKYSTGFLEEHGQGLSAPELPPHLEREWMLGAAAIDVWLERRCLQKRSLQKRGMNSREGNGLPPSPWQDLGERPRMRMAPSRLVRRYAFGKEARQAVIEVDPAGGETLAFSISWDGAPHRVLYRHRTDDEVGLAGDGTAGEGVLDLEELRLTLRWDAHGSGRWLTLRGRHIAFTSEDPSRNTDRPAGAEEAAERLRAPLPGKVAKVEVSEGEVVRPGQVLLILEAMKMEHKITAPYGGKVTRILHGEGDLVNRDDTLVEIEQEGD